MHNATIISVNSEARRVYGMERSMQPQANEVREASREERTAAIERNESGAAYEWNEHTPGLPTHETGLEELKF